MNDHDDLLLNAYHDGELSASEALDMERRLAADPGLRAKADRLAAMTAAVRNALLSPPAPEALRRRVIHTLAFRDPSPERFRWARLAAVLVVGLATGAALGTAATTFVLETSRASTNETLLNTHLRALAAPQPFDVASSDRHTVKPWFNGRTPLAPRVPDLSAAGFPLIGGRIDVVARRAVPTIVYRHGRHIVDVTTLARQDTAPEEGQSLAGFRIERWADGDLTYTAIADIPEGDLQAFVRAFRASGGIP